MTTIDQRFQQLAENHPLVVARYWEWLRGSFPANSVPDGRRSAERPVPRLDSEDRRLIYAKTQYDSWCRILMATSSTRRQQEAIDRLLHLQGVFLRKPEPIPDVWCDNPKHILNPDKPKDGLLPLGAKSGWCVKCRVTKCREAKNAPPANAHAASS